MTASSLPEFLFRATVVSTEVEGEHVYVSVHREGDAADAEPLKVGYHLFGQADEVAQAEVAQALSPGDAVDVGGHSISGEGGTRYLGRTLRKR